MTPGILPSAATRPASLFAPLLRRSAQNVTKKARHRTRCFAALRARQNALRFSARRGCSDSTSMYCFAIAAIHRRDPCGHFPPRLRCPAPRTAPLIHESVHPCTTPRRRDGKLWLGFGLALAWLWLWLCSSFCGRRPPKRGPLWRGEGAQDKSTGGRARCAAVRCMYMDVHPANPRSTLAHSQGSMPGERDAGGVFLWLPFFAQAAQAKKVTRSPAGRVEALLKRQARSRWISAFAGMTSKKRRATTSSPNPPLEGRRKKPAQRERQLRARWRSSCAFARLTVRRVPSRNSATTWPVS
jgi:hypothetical protein